MEPALIYLLLLGSGFLAALLIFFIQRLQLPEPTLVMRAVTTGAIAGMAGVLMPFDLPFLGSHSLLATIASVACTLWSRASDPSDALIGSSISSMLAAAIWWFDGAPATTLAAALVAAAAAGAFTSFLLRGRGVERLLWLFFLSAIPIAAEMLRRFAENQLSPLSSLAASSFLPPIAMLTIYLARRGVVALELRAEAELGILDREDAAILSHPIRRLKFGMWKNREARREYVRVADTLAETKAAQRSMETSTARLKQLEVLRLRMRLREIEAVEFASRTNVDGRIQ